MNDAQLTVRDVMARTGVNPITLRSWIRRAIVPHGRGRARGTRYSEEHVLRILAVQSLRAKGLGLEQVANRVWRMSDEELAAFAPASSNSATPPAPIAAKTPVAYPYRPLQWVPLIPGLTLLVDGECGELVTRLAQEIVERYAVHANAATPRT